jgi:hypothetical protein
MGLAGSIDVSLCAAWLASMASRLGTVSHDVKCRFVSPSYFDYRILSLVIQLVAECLGAGKRSKMCLNPG